MRERIYYFDAGLSGDAPCRAAERNNLLFAIPADCQLGRLREGFLGSWVANGQDVRGKLNVQHLIK
jgi:hypothetical protein